MFLLWRMIHASIVHFLSLHTCVQQPCVNLYIFMSIIWQTQFRAWYIHVLHLARVWFRLRWKFWLWYKRLDPNAEHIAVENKKNVIDLKANNFIVYYQNKKVLSIYSKCIYLYSTAKIYFENNCQFSSNLL